jgi:uncharacterized FAD-dependent dehydrogenase
MKQKIIELKVEPPYGYNTELLKELLLSRKILPHKETPFAILSRSIDARKKVVLINLKILIGELPTPFFFPVEYQDVSKAEPLLIIGAGPAGLFGALRAIELGFKPIILERGCDVRKRRRDLAAINKFHLVNPESNYCFGEGGAGTYSDGKLYTRSNKRGNIRKILEIMVQHGANPDILIDKHPHIGTNKLPILIQNIRNTILNYGGEIHFETKVIDFIIEKNKLIGVLTEKNKAFYGFATILATGHSSRDIFTLLQQKNILIEAKPFALGVRVEHPQELIDKIQYHCLQRNPYLPAARYELITHTKIKGKVRSIYSFCMCPGGFIVPAATQPGEVVVNGMSPSKRNSIFANSGIVVSIGPDDWKSYTNHKQLAAMVFQAEIETKACQMAGNTQKAPAQRLVDFVEQTYSSSLNPTSYQPGLESVMMNELLPQFITESLRNAFIDFGKKMKGFLTNEAQIIGVESRTSSPVRIPRNPETGEHVTLQNLFPCGEGAGYAGGIMSAAIDGQKCVELAICKKCN